MTPSPKIIAFIKGYEQCRLKAYMPTANDRPTIGWGSTGPDIKLGMTWTQAQCDERFAADLAKFAGGVTKALQGAATSQCEYDALVSLAYNIGLGNFASSTLLRKHRAGQTEDVPDQFARWNLQAGKILAGLVARRAAEARFYEGRA